MNQNHFRGSHARVDLVWSGIEQCSKVLLHALCVRPRNEYIVETKKCVVYCYQQIYASIDSALYVPAIFVLGPVLTQVIYEYSYLGLI